MYKELSEEVLAYYAGFFDGEGCIMINKHPGYRRLDIRISNTNEGILLEFAKLFGGCVYKNKRRKDTYKEKWQWCIPPKPAVVFLKAVYPFLRLKREEALLALEFQQRIKSSNNKPLTAAEIDIRKDYYLRMRALKRAI